MQRPFILNVDDYLPGRYSRTKILTQAGFDVREAGTGREALQIAKEGAQLILLDVNLPDMNGFEVCRRIKANTETAAAIVLHLSASNVRAEDRVAGLDSGADSYLTEPIAPEVLVATIRALLRAHSAEEALRRSNIELKHFANMISHELREPLRSVSMCADLLRSTLSGRMDAGEKRYMEHMLTGARRMSERIDSILEYSRAEHGRSDIADICAEDILAECVDELQMLLTESGAQVSHEALPRVRANRTGLARVFANLITNAVKYRSEEVPVISISAVPQGDMCLFAVRDNGMGIEPRFHGQIFEAFKRLHGAELSGAGLGLAICRRVIKSAGGEIWVDSALGKGSTFYFTLPASASV
ncbi:MAG TPA: ATP-binding protein [Bryobacteraceae bacterium]|jgi:signal transduction histidine kinase